MKNKIFEVKYSRKTEKKLNDIYLMKKKIM